MKSTPSSFKMIEHTQSVGFAAMACLFAAASGPQAKSASPALPFVSENSHEFTASIDFDHDGLQDVLIVDRATGLLRVGYANAGGAMTWPAPRPLSMPGVTGVSVGSVAAANGAAVAATSPMLNRVNVLQSSAAGPVAVGCYGFGPASVALTRGAGGAQPMFLISSLDNGATQPFALETRTEYPSATPGDFAFSTGWLRRCNASAVAEAAGVFTSPSLGDPQLRLYNMATVTPALLASLSPFPSNGDWAYGNFNGSFDTYLVWSSGDTALNTYRLTRGAGTASFAAKVSYTLAQPISQIIVIPGPASSLRFAAIFDDGASVGIYDYNGTTAPILAQTLTASGGQNFRSISPLGANFLALKGPSGAGSTSAESFILGGGGTYTSAGEVVLPEAKSTSSRANLVLTAAEPLVSASPGLRALLRTGDWSSSATVAGGNVSATSETYQNQSSGLGAATPVTLNGSTNGAAFVLANQYASDISIMPISSAIGPVETSPLLFSPPSGRFPKLGNGQTLNVTITAPQGGVFWYKDLAGEWQFGFGSAQVPVSADRSLTAFIGSQGPGNNGPMTTSTYQFGPIQLITPTDVDLDLDGLGDAWEQFFGVTNPNSDADGDGFTNLEEYNGGSSPLDSAARPFSGNIAMHQVGPPEASTIEITWPIGDARVILEITDSLDRTDWSQVMSGITTSGGLNRYQLSTSLFTRSFVRARRR